MLVMDKIPRKTMGGAINPDCGARIYLFTANQYVAHNADWFLPDYFRSICTFAMPRQCMSLRSGRQRPNSGSGLANAVGRISVLPRLHAVAVLLSSYGVTGVFILLGGCFNYCRNAIATIGIETKGVSVESLSIDAVANK